MFHDFQILDEDTSIVRDDIIFPVFLKSVNGEIDMNEDLVNKKSFIIREIYDRFDCIIEFKYNEEMYDGNSTSSFKPTIKSDYADKLLVCYSYYTIRGKIDKIGVSEYINMIDELKFLLKCCNVKVKYNKNFSKIIWGDLIIPIRYKSYVTHTPEEISKNKLAIYKTLMPDFYLPQRI